ncbi:Mechanosensitive ion channel-domain-containing protein [Spinellus fusiger]|nr:Mechanosensitive ion channel-domain-containing protein [Spinellus fusiger]
MSALKEKDTSEESITMDPNQPEKKEENPIPTTDDELQDLSMIEEGLPVDIPLSSLAGPALVTAHDLDGHTLTEEFDWGGQDEDDDDEHEKKGQSEKKQKKRFTHSGVFICLSNNSSTIGWTCVFLFACILIAIDISIFMNYRHRHRESMTSYHLEMWFTWISFMWCIGFMSHIFVEVLPWAVKKGAAYLNPNNTEVLRMRLSYYMALRKFIKCWLISAWAWGSWALIKANALLPMDGEEPYYVGIIQSVLQCCFMAALLLFIEKFILQLIVTSFHKKAYEERIITNDRALKVLDRLKRVKRKTPQEFLLKCIRRKPKELGIQSRSTSLDENALDLGQACLGNNKKSPKPNQPILTRPTSRSDSPENYPKPNVHFPTHTMDTLISIPPVGIKETMEDEKEESPSPPPETKEPLSSDTEKQHEHKKFFAYLSKKWKNQKKEKDPQTPREEKGPPIRPGLPPRENTGFSRYSQDERSFFNGARGFRLGTATAAVPGRLIKGGYKKLKSSQVQLKTSSQQAKALAKRIFYNIMGSEPIREFLVESDLHPFFATHEGASNAFALFDADGSGDVSKRELRSGCVRIYRERKNLARSMRDLSQATGKLDIILLIIFIVIWAIITCASFGVNVGTSLMPLWTAFIAASFVFGNSAKDAFEAIIFVFVTHPFDAGDRVLVGTENWVVNNVGLLVTTFNKWDGSIVYAKNSLLASQYIINCRRTGRTGETIDLHVHFKTPSWKIYKLREDMREWSNKFPKLYSVDSSSANIVAFENLNKITITFYFEHTQNWQDPGGRWLRHNNYMMELKEACERLDIYYTMPGQPVDIKHSDVPLEVNNMGTKTSYGLDGVQTRRPYHYTEDSMGPVGGHSVSGVHMASESGPGGGGDSGGGSAAAFMFATSL